MEGLEISEIQRSQLDKIKLRLDAEFYQKEFLILAEKISSAGGVKLSKSGASLNCSAFYPSITGDYNFEGIGVPFLRVNEIQNGLVSISDTTVFLPQRVLDENQKTICVGKPYDIIIAKGGNTLAKLGLLTEAHEKYALSRDLILLETQKLKELNKYYLWVFLHSSNGQKLLWRTASQTGQPHLTLPSIDEMEIPKVSAKHELKYEFLYKESVKQKNSAERIYAEAESLLLSEIGFDGFVPSGENINTKNYSDSFLSSGRLDSEYYLPKYDDYLELVNSYKGGVQPLSEACNLKDKNFSPEDDREYQYIELSNIGNTGEITGCTVSHGKELPSRARRIVRAGDVVVSSIEGSLESCAIVPKAYDGALCSTGFYVVHSMDINSETLLILFKSKPIQAILKQNCSGTILTAINKAEFLNIPIPLIDGDVQKEIQAKLKESITQREKSESLLEIAKRAVEIAIEQDEAVAERYIQDECRKIGVSLAEV